MALRRDVVSEFPYKGLMTYDQVKLIVMNLTHTSPLRKFVLDSYVSHWEPSSDHKDPCVFDSDTDPDNHMATFIYQVMKGIAVCEQDRDLSDCPCCNVPCEYHEHESKEEWKASMLTQPVWLQLFTNICLACGQDEDMEMPASLNSSK
jgi:hypothetical protein